jgi:hypothetical protein
VSTDTVQLALADYLAHTLMSDAVLSTQPEFAGILHSCCLRPEKGSTSYYGALHSCLWILLKRYCASRRADN